MAGKEKHIAIIGAGLAGLMTAYYGVANGFSISVYEAKTSEQSASAGLVGAMAPHMPEHWNAKKNYQFESLMMARAFWPEIESVTKLSTGFQQNGRWQAIGSSEDWQKAKMRENAALESWRGQAHWRVIDPEAHPFLDAPFGVIEDSLSAQIFPRQALLALRQACLQKGVKIYENSKVKSFGTGFLNAHERYEFDAVILAGGYQAWPFLRPFLGARFGEGTKGQAALFELKSDWHAPMITGDGYYIVPHAPRLLGVGSTSERYWSSPETDENLEDLLRRVHSEVTLPEYEVIEKWAGIRPRAYRPDPLMGEIQAGVFVNAGGFKTGFSFMNKLASDLVAFIAGKTIDVPENFRVENFLRSHSS